MQDFKAGAFRQPTLLHDPPAHLLSVYARQAISEIVNMITQRL